METRWRHHRSPKGPATDAARLCVRICAHLCLPTRLSVTPPARGGYWPFRWTRILVPQIRYSTVSARFSRPRLPALTVRLTMATASRFDYWPERRRKGRPRLQRPHSASRRPPCLKLREKGVAVKRSGEGFVRTLDARKVAWTSRPGEFFREPRGGLVLRLHPLTRGAAVQPFSSATAGVRFAHNRAHTKESIPSETHKHPGAECSHFPRSWKRRADRGGCRRSGASRDIPFCRCGRTARHMRSPAAPSPACGSLGFLRCGTSRQSFVARNCRVATERVPGRGYNCVCGRASEA
jgi:hypothetical protein